MTTVGTRIQRVVLLEDRAYLERRGTIALEAGSSQFCTRVSGLIVDRTATARVLSQAPVRILDLSVVRVQVPHPQAVPADLERLAQEVDELGRQLQRLGDDILDLSQQLVSLGQLAHHWLSEIAQNAEEGNEESWALEWRELEESERTLLVQQHQLQEQRDLTQQDWQQRSAELERRRALSPDWQAELCLTVAAESPCTLEFALDYCVPGACWRPAYQAHWQAEDIALHYQACVWQNTGEDWEEAQLFFSTRRPSLGARPPLLGRDILQLQARQKEVVVAARDEEIRSAGPGRQQVSQDLPGIDDGGEILLLAAPQPATVKADGEPVRVALDQFSCPLQLRHVVQAEICPEVVVVSALSNLGRYPLLAGPVDLVREGGLAGRTQLAYVARQEGFSLSWGPDSLVRVRREVQRGKEEKVDMLGSWLSQHFEVTLFLGNLTSQSRVLEVTERVPVSEVRQVEVVLDPQSVQPDADGLVRWRVELGPHQRQQLKLGYTLRRRKEVSGL